MRPTKEVLEEINPLVDDDHPIPSCQFRVLIEVLLDIRDALVEAVDTYRYLSDLSSKDW